MQETSAQGLKGALLRHGEKYACGILLLIFVGYAVMGLGASDEPEVQKLKQVTAQFQQKAQVGTPELNPPPIERKAHHESVEQVYAVTPWAASIPTVYKGELVKKAEPPPKTVAMPSVRLLEPVVSIDRIDLTWTLEEPKDKAATLADPATYYYYLERKKEDEEWQRLGREPLTFPENKNMKYQDQDIQPKTSYAYRILPGTKDPKYITRDNKSELGRMSNEVTARTETIWKISFANPIKTESLEEDTIGSVWITIEKFDAVAGRVMERKVQKEGEKIGWWPATEGAPATSKHPTWSARLRRTVDVDFDTKFVLKLIRMGQAYTYEYKKCPGGFNCPGPMPTKDTMKINEIHYVTEEGKTEIYRIFSREPFADQLCPQHGGGAEMTAEERKRKREEEAQSKLGEADQLWVSSARTDKLKAQRIYRDLLKDYSDTDPVQRRKSHIEDRVNVKVE
ncbi:MAG: hypothetical protein HY716_03120 [Planctomycetes bacterium]|nr:hypothetical protein [Planctomycetota bacterium]